MKELLSITGIKELMAKAADFKLGRAEQRQVKDFLEAMYTSMIYTCIDNALTRDANSLIFEDEEKLKIDMGIISDEAYLSDESKQNVREAWNNRTPPYHLRIYYLSDLLEEFYLNNQDFGINNLKRLEDNINELDRKVFQNQLELTSLQQNSDLLYKQLSDMSDMDPSLRKKVKEYILSRSLDQLEEKLMKNILELRWKQKHEKFTDKEEMINLSKCVLEQSKAKSIRKGILKEIKKPYNKPLIAKQLQDCYDNIENIKTEQFRFEKMMNSLIEEKNKFYENLSGFSLFKKDEALKSEVNRLQILQRTCGSRGKIMDPFLVHIFNQFVLSQEVITVIGQVNENDPALFSNPHRHHVGLPGLIFVPVQGSGFYDINSNCMFFPIFSHNVMKSVVDMLTDYRLEVDQDKVLMRSFTKEIPLHKKLHSYSRFKEIFNRYYMIWMTKGVRGYKVLNKDARQWFMAHMAPKNLQIRVPHELLVLGPNDIEDKEKRVEAELNENPDSALLYLKLGTIKSMLDRDLDLALECFLQALKLDPQFHVAEYNIAQIYMKLGKKQEANIYFLKYSSHNYQNWWTVVAREWAKQMKR